MALLSRIRARLRSPVETTGGESGSGRTTAIAPDAGLVAGAALADSLRRMEGLPAECFDALWAEVFGAPDALELIIGQGDYLRTHKRRFRELFNAFLALTPTAPRVLEFGTSEASRLYRRLKPETRLVTADRPVADDYIGFTPDKSRELASAAAHVAVDLERDDLAQADALREEGPFDFIVFTEVLEHLVAPPRPLLAGLLSHLAPGGRLYLTTPNFLCRRNRAILDAGRNPQPYYPGSDANWDRHHHHREYTMAELQDLLHDAGGTVEAAYYSGCWDPSDDTELQAWPELRGNLVLVAVRDGDARP